MSDLTEEEKLHEWMSEKRERVLSELYRSSPAYKRTYRRMLAHVVSLETYKRLFPDTWEDDLEIFNHA